jgi:hypothetical protein
MLDEVLSMTRSEKQFLGYVGLGVAILILTKIVQNPDTNPNERHLAKTAETTLLQAFLKAFI